MRNVRQLLNQAAIDLNLSTELAAEYINARTAILTSAPTTGFSELENASQKAQAVNNLDTAIKAISNSRLPEAIKSERIRNYIATITNNLNDTMLQRRDVVDTRPQAFDVNASKSLAPAQRISDSNAEIMPATASKLFDFKLSPTMIIAGFGIIGAILYFGKKKSKKASRKR